MRGDLRALRVYEGDGKLDVGDVRLLLTASRARRGKKDVGIVGQASFVSSVLPPLQVYL